MSGPGLGTGFQSFVNKELPPAIAGDFAGANIKASVIASDWGFIASPNGLLAGLIAWANPATKQMSQYFQPNSICGFVHRESQGTITTYLGVATMKTLGGRMAIAYDLGEFWGLFTAGATAGQKVYADPLLGTLTTNATGNSVTASNPTGTVSSNVLTLTGSTTGTIAIGQIVTGGTLPAGTYVASGSSLTWTLANADGTAIPNNASNAAYSFYGVQETQFYAAESVTADAAFTASLAVPAAGVAFGVLTVSAVASGALVPGQWISATGGGGLAGSANVQLLQQLTNTGANGVGTWSVSNVPAAVTSTNTFVATQGKLGKISSLANWW